MYYVFTQEQADLIDQVVSDNSTEGRWTIDVYAGKVDDGTYAVLTDLGDEASRRGYDWETLLGAVGIDINNIPQEATPDFVVSDD